MLFQNQNELSKNIAKLIDESVQFEVNARDSEIKSLKEKLSTFSLIQKEIKELTRNNNRLSMQVDGFSKMLDGFNK